MHSTNPLCHLCGMLQKVGSDKTLNSELSVSGLFEIHGAAVVPIVSVIAPEKLSASTRRRYEIQVCTLSSAF